MSWPADPGRADPGDLSDEAQVERVVQTAKAELGDVSFSSTWPSITPATPSRR